jgi:hypothetical protein
MMISMVSKMCSVLQVGLNPPGEGGCLTISGHDSATGCWLLYLYSCHLGSKPNGSGPFPPFCV